MKHLIAPSILAADFGKLREAVELVNVSQADWLHVDIMDGHFVPNISFGFPVLKAIQLASKKPLDVHLMIEHPERYIQRFRDFGADIISVHAEACPHLHRTIQEIKESGAKAGVAINPHTPITSLQDVIRDIDLVVLMAVNPGFGGQQLIEHTLHKTRQTKYVIESSQSRSLIEIDGGVTPQNAQALLDVGADVLVAGSSVFKSNDPIRTIEQLKELVPQSKMV